VRDTGCFDVPLPSYLDEILALRRWSLTFVRRLVE
jgi:hypothetical protein